MARDKIVSLRLSEVEWRAVQAEAGADSVKPSEWLRRVLARELQVRRDLRRVRAVYDMPVGVSVGNPVEVTYL